MDCTIRLEVLGVTEEADEEIFGGGVVEDSGTDNERGKRKAVGYFL